MDGGVASVQNGPILLMAMIGLAVIFFRRIGYDGLPVVGAELVIGPTLLMLAMFALHSPERGLVSVSKRRQFVFIGVTIVLLAMPWAADAMGRDFGYGNEFEILSLSSLAWAAALMSISPGGRTKSLSVISSGFLTLFTAFTADSVGITVFVYAWIAICLWWLVDRHWSLASCLNAAEVEAAPIARAVTLIGGSAAFILATSLVSDSIPILRKLPAEIMPTSGGTSSKDAAARKGVGNGDALIAAQNHASSFGAVETDFFLDSDKPSLFDVFSDEFGDPIKKEKVERTQALSPDEIRSQDGKFAEANRSSKSDEFSIHRETPALNESLDDLPSTALMFWEGRTGIRLAVQRFDTFSNETWQQSRPPSDPATLHPRSVRVGEALWFAPPRIQVQSSLSPFTGAIPEAVRFTRFGSAAIPIPAGAQLWRVDQLTLPDLFAYTADNCLYMPGRDAVPDYTVVRFVNSHLDAESLDRHMRTCAPGKLHQRPSSDCGSRIAELSHSYARQTTRGWPQVDQVIRSLRSDFAVEPIHQQPATLEQFLDQRQGPCYMFATTAALMLEHLGYETRLVTGFYVNPEHYLASERATAIQASDAHVWLEVNSGHGYWVPLEPTPGFLMPTYQASWSYWARQNWQKILTVTVACAALASLIHLLRAWLFRTLATVFSPALSLLPTRHRAASIRWLLDIRWKLIGSPRPTGITPRRRLTTGAWGLSPEELRTATEYFDFYDTGRFGNAFAHPPVQVMAAMPRIINRVKRQPHSQHTRKSFIETAK